MILGKEEVIEKGLMAMIAGGHILLDDVPGVGKTTLAVALSKALGVNYQRIQFTPDVLPGDAVGFSVYDWDSAAFRYMPGTVTRANLLLADEINRTPSKTQSALLEAKADGKLTMGAYIINNTTKVITTEGFDPEATYAVICDKFLIKGNDTYYTMDGHEVVASAADGLKTRDFVALYIDEVLNGTVGNDYALN